MFDPNQFLEMQITEANDTVGFLVPAGEYLAVIDSGEKGVQMRQWQKKDDPSVAGLACDIIWNIEDDSVKSAAGRDKVNVKQGIMLELTDSGGIDSGKGKNVDLGRLREALGMNRPGEAFSFLNMKGRMAKIKVSHRVDPKDSEKVYAEVKAVTKA